MLYKKHDRKDKALKYGNYSTLSLYVSDIEGEYHRLTREQEYKLGREIRRGTIYRVFPSKDSTKLIHLSRNHILIGGIFPELEKEAKKFQRHLSKKNILDESCPSKIDSKLQIKLRENYSINCYQTDGYNRLHLYCRTPEAEKARGEFILSNLPLVIKIVREFLSIGANRVSIEELIEKGNEVLIRCVDYYNPKEKNKFSSLLCDSLNKSFREMLSTKRNLKIKNLEIEGLDYFESQCSGPVDRTRLAEEESIVNEAVNSLEPRKRILMRLRYWRGETHKNIGEVLHRVNGKRGLTKERVRQLENEALEELAVILNS